MARKKHSPEQIVALLQQIEVAIANRKPIPQACREAGITEQSYYRWRKEYGGLKLEQARRLKELEKESLAIRVARQLNSYDLIETLADVMLVNGIPEHIRSDNGPEFVAKQLRKWLAGVGAKTLYIEPGSPWENAYCESFN